MLIDVKKARLNRAVGEDAWACIELPEEEYEEGKCGASWSPAEPCRSQQNLPARPVPKRFRLAIASKSFHAYDERERDSRRASLEA